MLSEIAERRHDRTPAPNKIHSKTFYRRLNEFDSRMDVTGLTVR
jgi:hypothetical protein